MSDLLNKRNSETYEDVLDPLLRFQAGAALDLSPLSDKPHYRANMGFQSFGARS